MNPETRCETQRIDHPGIVAGMSQEIGLIEEIDQQVGPSEQKVSVGQGDTGNGAERIGLQQPGAVPDAGLSA